MIDWIMYADIQRLKRMGSKKNRVSTMLSINRETVTKYWNMSPDEYDAFKFFCHCCGQRLNWNRFDDAKEIYIGWNGPATEDDEDEID